MRHRKALKKLGRDSSHRKAMFRNMVTSLFKYEQLETTDAKAKQLRPVAEKIITLAKRGDLHARRQALAYITDKAITHRLFEDLRERYLDRQGGYVRIIKKGHRRGDGAPISVVQLLPEEEGKKKRKKKAKAPKSAGTAETKKKKETKVKEEEKQDQKKGDKKEKKAGEKKEKKEEEKAEKKAVKKAKKTAKKTESS
jgi:large subunit ribosomal protein L17